MQRVLSPFLLQQHLLLLQLTWLIMLLTTPLESRLTLHALSACILRLLCRERVRRRDRPHCCLTAPLTWPERPLTWPERSPRCVEVEPLCFSSPSSRTTTASPWWRFVALHFFLAARDKNKPITFEEATTKATNVLAAGKNEEQART